MSYIERTAAEIAFDRKRNIIGAVLQNRVGVAAVDSAPVYGSWFQIPRWVTRLAVELKITPTSAATWAYRMTIEGDFEEGTDPFTLHRIADVSSASPVAQRVLFRSNLADSATGATIQYLPLSGTNGAAVSAPSVPRLVRAGCQLTSLTGQDAMASFKARMFWR